MSYEEVRCRCCWESLPFCTRGLGVATAVVLWGVGVDMVYHHHILGIYILVLSLTLLFLEITWAITLFLHVCIRNESSKILWCWSGVLWVDTWKKALLYWTCAAALLLKPHTLWLTSVSGGLLISLGFFHLLLLYMRKLVTKDPLLEAKEDSYDRYDDEMDSSPAEPANSSAEGDTVSTQDYVLQV